MLFLATSHFLTQRLHEQLLSESLLATNCWRRHQNAKSLLRRCGLAWFRKGVRAPVGLLRVLTHALLACRAGVRTALQSDAVRACGYGVRACMPITRTGTAFTVLRTATLGMEPLTLVHVARIPALGGLLVRAVLPAAPLCAAYTLPVSIPVWPSARRRLHTTTGILVCCGRYSARTYLLVTAVPTQFGLCCILRRLLLPNASVRVSCTRIAALHWRQTAPRGCERFTCTCYLPLSRFCGFSFCCNVCTQACVRVEWLAFAHYLSAEHATCAMADDAADIRRTRAARFAHAGCFARAAHHDLFAADCAHAGTAYRTAI